MIKRLELRTTSREQLIDITAHIRSVLRNEDFDTGIAVIYVPHTTCGVTINENADPSVKEDIMQALSRLVTRDFPYRHEEGNADAHIKASLVGSSVTVMVESGTMILGTWQGVFLAEFDGPRMRSVLIKLLSG